MENRAYALAAGLFTLIFGISVVAAALWLGGNVIETQQYLLVSRYPVTGLNVQAPVRFRGVTVGKVVEIRFDPLDLPNILVEVSVQTGTPLTRGTYAKLGSQGITGLSYVILDDDGKNPEPLLGEGDELARIEVRPSFMDTVTASGEELIQNANKVAGRVQALLSDENTQQLLSTLRSMDKASSRVASLATELEPVVKDAGIALKRADTLMASFDRRLDSFERAAKGADQLSETLVNESLPRLNVLLEDLQRNSRSLERLLSDLDEQPSSIVFGKSPQPPGPGEPGFGKPRGAQ
jgi:phospholipid/cholesterol/gamma-HCH transport system substrate-binding protein